MERPAAPPRSLSGASSAVPSPHLPCAPYAPDSSSSVPSSSASAPSAPSAPHVSALPPSNSSPSSLLELLCPRCPFPLSQVSQVSQARSAAARRGSAAACAKRRKFENACAQSPPQGSPPAPSRLPVARLRRLQTLLRLSVVARCMCSANAEAARAAAGEEAQRTRTKKADKRRSEASPGKPGPSAAREPEPKASPLGSASVRCSSPASTALSSRWTSSPASSEPAAEAFRASAAAVRQPVARLKEEALGPAQAGSSRASPPASKSGNSRGHAAAAGANPVRRDLERMPLYFLHPKHRPLALLFRAQRDPEAPLLRPLDFQGGRKQTNGATAGVEEGESEEGGACASDEDGLLRMSEEVTSSSRGTAQRPERRDRGGANALPLSLSHSRASPEEGTSLDDAVRAVLTEENVFPRVADYLRRYFHACGDRRRLTLGLAPLTSPSASAFSASSAPSPQASPARPFAPSGPSPVSVERPAFALLAQPLAREDSRRQSWRRAGLTQPRESLEPCSEPSAAASASQQRGAARPPLASETSPASARHPSFPCEGEERPYFSFDQAARMAPLPQAPESPSVASLLQSIRARVRRGERSALTAQSLLAFLESHAEGEAWQRIAAEYLRAFKPQNEPGAGGLGGQGVPERLDTESQSCLRETPRAADFQQQSLRGAARLPSPPASSSPSVLSAASGSLRRPPDRGASGRRASEPLCSQPLPAACAVLERLREEYRAELEKAVSGGHDPLPGLAAAPCDSARVTGDSAERTHAAPRRSPWEHKDGAARPNGRHRGDGNDAATGAESASQREGEGAEASGSETGRQEEARGREGRPAARGGGAEGVRTEPTNPQRDRAGGERRPESQEGEGDEKARLLDAQVELLLEMYLHTDQLLRQIE
ncbi:hypothetical protein BESB_045670 [Besnoitia besnoiti]|uniref:Uncharacterized protein n=1 Tax=Besnoitia besnoiti TaxID=94643 RepID=A0A2A9MEG4_BESBE|nr:hypothetical protein BESB_045670 [Besnoitia besnoiti]PFH36375.1 hypothetical protein BESB_045670 [Besnoitia besnoiti]